MLFTEFKEQRKDTFFQHFRETSQGPLIQGFEGKAISHSRSNPCKSEILGSRGLKFNVKAKKRHSRLESTILGPSPPVGVKPGPGLQGHSDDIRLGGELKTLETNISVLHNFSFFPLSGYCDFPRLGLLPAVLSDNLFQRKDSLHTSVYHPSSFSPLSPREENNKLSRFRRKRNRQWKHNGSQLITLSPGKGLERSIHLSETVFKFFHLVAHIFVSALVISEHFKKNSHFSLNLFLLYSKFISQFTSSCFESTFTFSIISHFRKKSYQ